MERDRWIHILDDHKQDFKDMFGIAIDALTIGNFIFNAIKNYPLVGDPIPGQGGQSKIYVYKIIQSGKIVGYLKVLVLYDGYHDGFIVSAFPSPNAL